MSDLKGIGQRVLAVAREEKVDKKGKRRFGVSSIAEQYRVFSCWSGS